MGSWYRTSATQAVHGRDPSPIYFCDPRSPWQRGTNENTNRLLRQYFLDGTNLAEYSQDELNVIAHKLNTRPRKTLAYIAPIDKIAEPLR